MNTNSSLPHPSTVIPIDNVSLLLRTSFTQAEPVCRYLVLELAGLASSAILGLRHGHIDRFHGTLELLTEPASLPAGTSPRRTVHVPMLHRSWLALFATDRPDVPFITTSQPELLRHLAEIRRQLRIGWADATMRRTAFTIVLSHGLPCPDCIHALGFASSFPTLPEERAAYPFGAWRRLLPQVVLPPEAYRQALGADAGGSSGRPQP